jgi:hypothetical protein
LVTSYTQLEPATSDRDFLGSLTSTTPTMVQPNSNPTDLAPLKIKTPLGNRQHVPHRERGELQQHQHNLEGI